MTFQKITLSATLVALLAISLYLLIALPLLRDTTAEVKLPIATDTDLHESKLAARVTKLAGEHSNIAQLSETPAITRTRFIEIHGSIIDSAGRPIEAVPQPEYLQVPDELLGSKPCYVLKVRGDSMIEEGILDGDYVVIEQRDSANNGEIVVALVRNEEVTLKRIEQKPGEVVLHPANASMEAMA